MISELVRSENPLSKVKNPGLNIPVDRNSYYTNISYVIHGSKVESELKVDTGASHTIIGLGRDELSRYKNFISKSQIVSSAFTATNQSIPLIGVVLDEFWLTQDIVIPNILIFFSESLGKKAVLGMDILSMFNFQYRIYPGKSWGHFYINDYEKTLEDINERVIRRKLGYVDPYTIMECYEFDNIDQEADSSIKKSAASCLLGII